MLRTWKSDNDQYTTTSPGSNISDSPGRIAPLYIGQHLPSDRYSIAVELFQRTCFCRRGSPSSTRICRGGSGRSWTRSAANTRTTCWSRSSRRMTPGYAPNSYRYAALAGLGSALLVLVLQVNIVVFVSKSWHLFFDIR
jgi:hypothetical protein